MVSQPSDHPLPLEMIRIGVAVHRRLRLGQQPGHQALQPSGDRNITVAGIVLQPEHLAEDSRRIAVLLWHIESYFIMRRIAVQGGSMTIRTFGDPVVRRPAETVEEIDDEIRAICARMVEEMIRAEGVGLAAPQIGISKRIIVLDVDGEFHILINPELLSTSDETEQVVEGCLSVPGVNSSVERSTAATITGTTLEGEAVTLTGQGLLARAMQHEMDHLNGKLFVDRLGPAKRRSLLKEYARLREDS